MLEVVDLMNSNLIPMPISGSACIEADTYTKQTDCNHILKFNRLVLQLIKPTLVVLNLAQITFFFLVPSVVMIKKKKNPPN